MRTQRRNQRNESGKTKRNRKNGMLGHNRYELPWGVRLIDSGFPQRKKGKKRKKVWEMLNNGEINKKKKKKLKKKNVGS